MSADKDFLDMIESVQRLADLPEEAVKLAAPIVLKVAQDFARAGTTPYGEPWPAKKRGGRPLVNSAKALSAVASGAIIRITLKGVEVLHNFGTNALPVRQILPNRRDALPPAYAAAVKQAADKAFAQIVEGR